MLRFRTRALSGGSSWRLVSSPVWNSGPSLRDPSLRCPVPMRSTHHQHCRQEQSLRSTQRPWSELPCSKASGRCLVRVHEGPWASHACVFQLECPWPWLGRLVYLILPFLRGSLVLWEASLRSSYTPRCLEAARQPQDRASKFGRSEHMSASAIQPSHL